MIIPYEISPNVILATPENDTVNMGGVKLENYSIAIDSGRSFRHGENLRKSLEDKYNLPIEYLILTHHHDDHISGIKAFDETILVFNKKLQRFLPRDIPRKEIFHKDKSLILKDQTLRIEVHHVGGHTPDSSFIYIPHEKIIFTGDLIFSGFKEPYPWSLSDSNPDLWIKAIEDILQLDAETIIPGHGPILSKKEVNHVLGFYQNIRELLQDSISRGIKLHEVKAPNSILDYKLFKERDISLNEEFEKALTQTGIGRRHATLQQWFNFYKKKGLEGE